MAKRYVSKFMVAFISLLLAFSGIIGGCGKKNDKDDDVGPQPLYGPPSVSVNHSIGGK